MRLAVEVRQCPLRCAACSWCPVVPTEIWSSRLAGRRMEEAGGKEEEEDGRRQATFMNSITWQVGNVIYIDRRIKEKQLSFQPSETSGDRIMELIWLTQNDPCGGQRLLQQRMSITSREPLDCFPASRKVKFYEVFCKRPSFTRSSGLLGFIELSPFSHQC